MALRFRVPKDPNVLAIPAFAVAMAVELRGQRRRAATVGPTNGDYEWRDTLASLTMGTASLVAPLVVPKLLKPFGIGRGRAAKVAVVGTVAAAAITTAADAMVRRSAVRPPTDRRPDGGFDMARVSAVGGVATVVMGGVIASGTWAGLTSVSRFWRHRLFGRHGKGPLAVVAAVAGWDFLYYWNHRLSHESRYLWAVHVVHHSSERYNLSTALRQPVADEIGPCIPYGVLALFGMAPESISIARSVNLLYQFWIHTERIGRLGRPEEIVNSPSHHRVHHGSNSQYIDRNYGSILIVWDRLFGTFEPEDEPVVYGLTTNLDTFNPGRIAFHEHSELLRGVARSTSWGERLSVVFRGPGWSYRHEAERTARLEALSVEALSAGAPPTGSGPTGPVDQADDTGSETPDTPVVEAGAAVI